MSTWNDEKTSFSDLISNQLNETIINFIKNL